MLNIFSKMVNNRTTPRSDNNILKPNGLIKTIINENRILPRSDL